MYNISGYGLTGQCLASISFPAGFTITEFADNADPLDFPAFDYAQATMGLNGDMLVSNKANPIMMTLNVIADSPGDQNLALLFELNRVGKGKQSVQDVITFNLIYPGLGGKIINLINGVCLNAMPDSSISSEGRKKSKQYTFAFENKIGD